MKCLFQSAISFVMGEIVVECHGGHAAEEEKGILVAQEYDQILS